MSKQSLATGIWNSVKRNVQDPWIMGSAAIGAGIGIYEAATVEGIQGDEIEMGAAGALTGAAIGMGLKYIGEQPIGLPLFGRGAI
jgi:hypothetical protein